jgi:arylamine N-acetyltransferase
MNRTRDAIREVEALMLHQFRTEPFHNLHMLPQLALPLPMLGGTCSDKALSFQAAVTKLGVPAFLHSAFIGGQEIHRLVRVEIDGRAYFADVGNGWPSIHLYPSDREISYRCFGMRFRTSLHNERLSVFNHRGGVERHQQDIPLVGRSEREILDDIEHRFVRGITYPFSDGIRFSQVVDDAFLFLRDDRLEIHREGSPPTVIDGLPPDRLEQTLREHFHYGDDQHTTRSRGDEDPGHRQ